MLPVNIIGPKDEKGASPFQERLPEKCESPRARIAVSGQPVEIHPRGESRGVEPDFMKAGILPGTDQCGHPLAENAENGQRHLRPPGDAVADSGGGIEGIGVILLEPERTRDPDSRRRNTGNHDLG